MKSNYKRLGDYIRPCNEFNDGMEVKELLGISNNKFFQASHTNTIGIDLQTYRIVRTGQFAYNRATTRNGDKISIALREGNDCIVSPSYRIFQVKNENELLSEYLMMWFRRPEFDRYARFRSHGSAHEFFEWDQMCEVELPVPHIDKQKEIVKEYNTIIDRIKLNNQLIQKLEETAQAIYKQWFVDFEFPNTEGVPYKSNGGEMVESELGEIPKGWKVGNMSDLYEFQYGLGNNNPDNNGIYPVYGSNGVIGGYDKYNNEDAPVIGHIGANCGSIVFAFGKHYVTYNGVMCNIKDKNCKWFGYFSLLNKDLKSQTRGSSQPFISYDMLYEISVIIPNNESIYLYNGLGNIILNAINITLKENILLEKTKDLLLSKLATQKP
jgi:type I restriction enzyme S subunit